MRAFHPKIRRDPKRWAAIPKWMALKKEKDVCVCVSGWYQSLHCYIMNVDARISMSFSFRWGSFWSFLHSLIHFEKCLWPIVGHKIQICIVHYWKLSKFYFVEHKLPTIRIHAVQIYYLNVVRSFICKTLCQSSEIAFSLKFQSILT